jgi:predicted NAD/FAD-dependent oxidoreductase
VRKQLREWFGLTVDTWRHLRTYPIEYALPRQTPPALDPVAKNPRVNDGVYRCGDYCDTASINGAMAAGRRAAEAVIEDAGVAH